MDVRDTVGSTNDVMRDHLFKGVDAGGKGEFPDGISCIIAWEQTVGRGRTNRNWSSPRGGVYFSMGMMWPGELATLEVVQMAIPIALTRTMRSYGVEARVKWPNDVMVDGCKVAGVLMEAGALTQGVDGRRWVVVGVGVNLEAQGASGMQDVDVPVGYLCPSVDPSITLDLIRSCSEVMRDVLGRGEEARAHVVNEFSREIGPPGRSVTTHLPDGSLVTGKVNGVDGHGHLMLETAEGMVTVVVGDILQ